MSRAILFRLGFLSILVSLLSSSCVSMRSVGAPSTMDKSDAKALLRKYEAITGVRYKLKRDFLLLYTIDQWMGTPYSYGKHVKGKGTDCSGFTYELVKAYKHMEIPRSSTGQYEYCDLSTRQRRLKKGDLVFFSFTKSKGKPSHVGLYLGNFHFVHASTSRGVIIDDIRKPYYQDGFIAVGKLPSADGRRRTASK